MALNPKARKVGISVSISSDLLQEIDKNISKMKVAGENQTVSGEIEAALNMMYAGTGETPRSRIISLCNTIVEAGGDAEHKAVIQRAIENIKSELSKI